MLAVHSIHRRLAELQMKADRIGGYTKLSKQEQDDLHHCLIVNAQLVYKMDFLKQLSLQAHIVGDMEWQHDICKRIDDLEVKCI